MFGSRVCVPLVSNFPFFGFKVYLMLEETVIHADVKGGADKCIKGLMKKGKK